MLVSLSFLLASTHHILDFFFAAQSSFSPSPGPSDVQLATLAQRVKEVLPHVPLGIIQRDLGTGKGSPTQEDTGKVSDEGEGEQGNRPLLLSSLLPSQDWMCRLDHHQFT